MHKTKFYVALFFVIIFAGIFTISPVISLLTKSVVVRNSGLIVYDLNATIVSPATIQAVVDKVFAEGGGTVFIPEGDFIFDPPAGGNGVVVPPGVNLVGAGKGKTILRETTERIGSTMIFVDGLRVSSSLPQKPVLIKGISFMGFVPSRPDADNEQTGTNNAGLRIRSIKDFVVYDCEFSNFVNSGFSATANDGQSLARYYMSGVVSNCDFDNPYKLDPVIEDIKWGYGIMVGGPNNGFADTTWQREAFGQYESVPFPGCIVYIEDCVFKRCRHSIAGGYGSGCHYVTRYNKFYEQHRDGYGGHLDVHPGGRSFEMYNNELYGYDHPPQEGRPAWNTLAFQIRGGEGVIYNNVMVDCNSNQGQIIVQDEWDRTPEFGWTMVWAWNNEITFPNSAPSRSSSPINVLSAHSVVYERQPNQTQDGFTYTPYPYPHPLVASLSP